MSKGSHARYTDACGLGVLGGLALTAIGSLMPGPPSRVARAAPPRVAAVGPAAVFLNYMPRGARPTPLPPHTYTITLVGLNGRVLAQARAATRHDLPTAGAFIWPLPVVSASRTRVYYLDGDTQVRYLTPTGQTGLAGRLPGGPRLNATFAVSPDDRRIAVTTLDYSTAPTRMQLFVEDLGGGHRAVLRTAPEQQCAGTYCSRVYTWAFGWHGGTLLLATGGDRAQNSNGNPYGAWRGYLVAETTHGRIIHRICTGTRTNPAQPTGLAVPAGTACRQASGLNTTTWAAADWSGHTRLVVHVPAEQPAPAETAVLSPDGRLAMMWCGRASMAPRVRPAAGAPPPCQQPRVLTLLAADGRRSDTALTQVGPNVIEPEGWVDRTHLLYATSVQQPAPPGGFPTTEVQLAILETRTGTRTALGRGAAITLGPPGGLVAVLPGGL